MKYPISIILSGITIFMLSAATAGEKSAGAGKFFGKAYYEYNHPLAKEHGYPQFRFTRYYFGYDYSVNDDVSIRYLLDAGTVSIHHDSVDASEGKIRPFMKHGYASFSNLIPKSKFYVGMQGTPNWSYSEGFWGYRSVEKTIQDRYHIGSSADLGFGIKTTLPANLSLHILYANGGGYGKQESNKYKKLYAQLAYESGDKLTISLFFDYEPQDEDYANSTVTLFVGTHISLIKVGLEYVNRTNQGDHNVTENGISIFSNVDIGIGKVFGRVDQFTTDNPAHGDELLILAGFDYELAYKVHVMPNFSSLAEGSNDPENTFRITFEFKY